MVKKVVCIVTVYLLNVPDHVVLVHAVGHEVDAP